MSPETQPGRSWRVFAIIAVVGLTLAVLQYVLDNRDPIVFTIPILVVTSLALLATYLAGGERGDGWREEAEELGLTDDGVRPLPPVTPILADVAQPTRVCSGQLYADGPWVRMARVRGMLVAITDAPATALDDATLAPLHARGEDAAIADGLLVVRGGDSPRALLDVTRELHARL